ncbi:MAG: 6-carboxytetrahydropterin synthase QueD [Desulfobulbaceae bacterium]|jgi:6-pyruvoyltetrahydropterin/6-carboxytetrahydropterin synthase|nr:6-carboxytetrahydropterin synthase QueD [Desulfobulbaceae bacterium]
MYDIFVTTHFAGAHHLRNYPGNCEHPHGHNWKVVVTVRASKLDQLGMGIDFKVLKKHVNEVVDTIDHRDLNEHPAFQTINPSSEHIARYIYDNLAEKLTSDRYHLYSVGVSETETSSLIYYGED